MQRKILELKRKGEEVQWEEIRLGRSQGLVTPVLILRAMENSGVMS